MKPLDTTPQAANVQTDVLRRLTPIQRLAIAVEMSELAQGLAFLRWKSQFPELSERDLRVQIARLDRL